MSWIAAIAGLAVAALLLAFATDARLTKCEAFSVASVIGLCTPRPTPEPDQPLRKPRP